ncbi:MAG: sugar phosphate isomerase/epimerase [Sphingorhabdus sp.]
MADRLQPDRRVFYAGTRQGTPLLDRIRPVRDAGFTAMSVWPGDVKGVDRCELRAALDAAGMVLTDLELIGNWLPGHQHSSGAFAQIVRPTTAQKLLPLAAELGISTVSVVELLGLDWDGQVMGKAFAQLCDQAADHGVRLAIEFVPTGAIADFARALELVERADRSNGGIMVDSWHFFRSGSSLSQLAQCPGDRIFSIQLNDAKATAEVDLNVGMMHRLLPGEGELDLPGLISALAATGTIAPTGIETFSARLDAMDMREAAQECATSLEHYL